MGARTVAARERSSSKTVFSARCERHYGQRTARHLYCGGPTDYSQAFVTAEIRMLHPKRAVLFSKNSQIFWRQAGHATQPERMRPLPPIDRKSTRLNSS